jgi:hypothetical protein
MPEEQPTHVFAGVRSEAAGCPGNHAGYFRFAVSTCFFEFASASATVFAGGFGLTFTGWSRAGLPYIGSSGIFHLLERDQAAKELRVGANGGMVDRHDLAASEKLGDRRRPELLDAERFGWCCRLGLRLPSLAS